MHKNESGGRADFWKATILTGAKISATMVSKQERTADFPEKRENEKGGHENGKKANAFYRRY